MKGAAYLNPCHLKGILIQPTLDRFKAEFFPSCFEGEFQCQKWRILKTKTWACTLFDKIRPINPSQEKTHTPFRLAWGDLNRLYSLVCQGGNIEKVLCSQPNDPIVKVEELAPLCENDRIFILNFDLKEAPAIGEGSPKREIEFFADFHPDILFRINGMPATTFELGQKIEIIAENLKLSILFECAEGDGRFFGHLMRGNRPSQLRDREGTQSAGIELLSPNTKALAAKRNSLAPSYDWTLFLRTLRRSPYCKIKATIHVHD